MKNDYFGGGAIQSDTDAHDPLPPIVKIDFPTIEDKKFKNFFMHCKLKLGEFTKDWNDNDRNRDQTYTVFT